MKLIGNETEITMFKELVRKKLLNDAVEYRALFVDAEPVTEIVKILGVDVEFETEFICEK